MGASTFDYVIVGGGSAGAVLASRLSARSANRVLLIEAGRDVPPDDVPAEISDVLPRSVYYPRNLWPELRAMRQPVPHNAPERPPEHPFEQARVLGGGSSVNAMIGIRGAPADFEEWVERGADGWSWQEVLPYYRRLESDADFDGPEHGCDGPIPVRRSFPQAWPGFTRACAEAARASGYRYIADHNVDFGDGCCACARTAGPDWRATTAVTYLNAQTRARGNLEIRTDTLVRGLRIADGVASGVDTVRADREERVNAGEVIVAAGAIHSPALLLRSGIGPVHELRELGIPVVADRPGVGRDLQEHPLIGIAAHIPRRFRQPATQRLHGHAVLRYSSGLPGGAPQDMFMLLHSKFGWHPLGRRLAVVLVALYKPFSRGWVRLRSRDARREPEVALNLLADSRDLHRLVDGVRRVYALYRHPAMKGSWNALLPATYSARVRRLNRWSRLNWLATGALAMLLDANAGLRDFLVRRLMVDGAGVQALMSDADALEAWVREGASPAWHVSGTCRMGDAGDPGAVVDPCCRVHGIGRLRVVDASVMPCVPRANTNLTTIMIAEKIADSILAGR